MVALSHEAIEYSNPAAKSSARRPSVRRTALDKRVPEAPTKVLTDTLKRLERAGLVQREIIADVPSHVEYSLSPQGIAFLEPLRVLGNWCDDHRTTLEAAQS